MGTRSTHIIRAISIIVLLSAALLPLGIVQAQSGGEGPPNGIGTFFRERCFVDLPPGVIEGQDVECGYVIVPLRHAEPDGATLRLAVVVVKANAPNAAPDPLVLENGGPGVPSTVSAPGLAQFDLFRAARDMVFIDQRGTGYSQPTLACEAGAQMFRETYGQYPTNAEALALEADALQWCYDGWRDQGLDPSAFNSLENAADIPLVMAALGYETYNFYGISYSSGLAQHIMRDHPAGLRSVVLDGVVPVSVSFMSTTPQTSQRAFDLLFAACAADPLCGSAFPDLESVFYDLVAQYNTEPQTYTFTNPWGGSDIEGVVSGETLVIALYQHIYDRGADPLLPASIMALAEGNPHFIEHYVSPTRFGTLREVSGMSNAVICSEYQPRIDAPALEGVHPAVAQTMGWYMDYTPVCAIWQVEALPAAAFEPVQSDIPTLLLSGEFDPVTPPANADLVAAGLTNAYVYTFPGVGHGAMGSSTCGFQMVLDFVDDPTRAPDSACLDDLSVRFTTSLDSAAGLTLEQVTVAGQGVRPLIPQGWIAVEEGVFVAPSNTAFVLTTSEPDWDTALAGFDSPQVSGSIRVGERVWTIYGAEFQSFIGTVAITTVDDSGQTPGVYVVGLFASTAEELGQLTGAILLPMLDGFAALN